MRISRLTGRSIHLRALEALPSPSLLVDLGVVLALISLPLLPNFSPTLTLYLFLLYALHIASATIQRLKIPRWLPTIFMFIGLLLILKHYHTILGYEAGIAFFTMLLGPKLLEIRKRRDFNITINIGLFLVLLQFLLNQSLYKVLYMLPLVVALFGILIQSNRVAPLPRKAALILALRLVAQALPLMVVLFVLFPRLSTPLWTVNLKLGHTLSKIGLADDMSPGSIGQLMHSDAVAFRAELQGMSLSPQNLYWRGPVLWRTDGLRWYDGPPQNLASVPLLQKSGRVNYRVILEPNAKSWVLALDLPWEAPPEAKLGADFQIRSKIPIEQRTMFVLTSFLNYRTGAISQLERAAALQAPNYKATNRLVVLVKNWQRQAQGQPQRVVEQALEFFRHEHFIYTLDPPPLGFGGIETFLFETRTGFCEHYAGAFTLLMRLAGIPSRVVTGYLGGEYNALGHYYLVHQEDAHAWSEVWLPELGWVRIDPTAAVAPERIQHSIVADWEAIGVPVTFNIGDIKGLEQVMRSLRLAMDAISTRWQFWVLGYDTKTQMDIVNNLGLGFLDRIGVAVFMVLFAMALSALLAWILANQRPPTPKDVPAQLYRRLCQRLAKIGILRPDREGPQDFAQRVARRRPDLAVEVKTMINLYISARYRAHANVDTLRELAQLLTAFHPRRLH